jgi:hypothetical protein
MPQSYLAILKGDRVEWVGAAPPTGDAVWVKVRLLPPLSPEDAARGARMLEVLNALAARGGVPEYGDPVEWQREIRKDRPLPGREDQG